MHHHRRAGDHEFDPTLAKVIDDLADRLHDFGVLGVGIAYKPNVGDDRESAAIEVLRELQRWGADITVLDPLIPDARILEHGFAPADDILGEYDLAIVLTDHSGLNLSEVARSATSVFDTRNAFRNQNLSLQNVSTL